MSSQWSGLLSALDAFERKTARAGEGFYVRLWADGSGELVRSRRSSEATALTFADLTELVCYLTGHDKGRRQLQRKARTRERRDFARLDRFVSERLQ